MERHIPPVLEVNIDRESTPSTAQALPSSADRPTNQMPPSGAPTLQPYTSPEFMHGAQTAANQSSPQALSREEPTPSAKETRHSAVKALVQDEDQDQSQGQDQSQDILGRSLLMARAQVVDPFAGKRVQALSVQTHDLIFGPYAEAWRQKVEQVGALNYPAPDHGHELQGDVRLTVILYPDGSIARLEVRQSSGIEALDTAAQHIVQMASPFLPFTKAMRERADLVTLTRTFHFIRAGETLEMH